ncbi:MAG: hypothetical protein ACUVYA_11330 [Planctomycetota bacterium]
MKVVFDNRLMTVVMRGGVDSNGILFDEQEVISYTTAPFPEGRLSNIGFAASTGGANAHQWIDNLVVREVESKVTFDPEAPLTAAGINCAGPAVDATAEIGVNFRQEVDYGGELGRSGDLETGLTIRVSRFGRVARGADFTNANARQIDVSKIPGAGPETAKVLADDAWSTSAVEYRADVVPGRYEVSFYWAENYAPAIDLAGRGTKLYDVYVNGERVFCNWSAAVAAGSPTGSGDPGQACAGRLDTGVVRKVIVDVPAEPGETYGILSVVVDDLGGGNPPENAALHALSFKPDTGGGTDQRECVRPPEAPAPAKELIAADFDDVPDGQCPPGAQCLKVGTGTWNAQVVGGRLRMLKNAATSLDEGTIVVFDPCVNVVDTGLEAEFDVYLDWMEGQDPADGGAFFVREGESVGANIPWGGDLAIPLDAYGFAVEFDTYGWCCGNNEPSGLSVPGAQYVHLGINNLSANSAITMVQYDPDLKPVSAGGTGWPDFRNPAGVHVWVTYNAGRVKVELEGVTEDGGDFPRTVVAEAEVPPIRLPKAIVGFTGATGGLYQGLDYDSLIVRASDCREPTPSEDPLGAAEARAKARWRDEQELYINCGGPPLLCGARKNPAPLATGDADEGPEVVWVGDTAAGATEAANDLFTVTSIASPAKPLAVQATDMGEFDARGTSPGVNDVDRTFHAVRVGPVRYEIPVPDPGPWVVTLYFANHLGATAGTARRAFHIDIEGERKGGFPHCEYSGKRPTQMIENRFKSFPEIFDPVDAAEHIYGSEPCAFVACDPVPGCTSTLNPDLDDIPANLECGNAAVVPLRYQATVADGKLTIELTVTAAPEPLAPTRDPAISGISLWKGTVTPRETLCADGIDNDGDELTDCADPDCAAAPNCQGKNFRRADPNDDGQVNITDGIYVLNFLFLGGPEPTCSEAADPNDDGGVNITDGIYILNFLFLGGPEPLPPGIDCGSDPPGSVDLGCASYTHC